MLTRHAITQRPTRPTSTTSSGQSDGTFEAQRS